MKIKTTVHSAFTNLKKQMIQAFFITLILEATFHKKKKSSYIRVAAILI